MKKKYVIEFTVEAEDFSDEWIKGQALQELTCMSPFPEDIDFHRKDNPWQTGKPTEEGDYLVIVEFKKGDTNYDTDYWVNGAWDWYYNQDGVCKIVAWHKIEPYKESEE